MAARYIFLSSRLIRLSLPQNPKPYPTPVTFTMSWSCTKCTYRNPPTQKSACQVCLTPSLPPPAPSSSSSSTSRWSCKACTFANKPGTSNCEICGTRASASLISDFEELDSLGPNHELLDPAIGSVFYPLKPCTNKRKIDRLDLGEEESPDLGKFREGKASRKEEPFVENLEVSNSSKKQNSINMSDEIASSDGLNTLKILTYNVWFREDLELYKRMKALGDLIQQHSPDVICFQEVTPNIYDIFQQTNWWKGYRSSLSAEMVNMRPYFCMQLSKLPVKSFSCKPFSNTDMGRELCLTEVELKAGRTLVVATSHLESPCPAPPKWDQMFSKERVAQAKEAIIFLNNSPNVIFCGDMNWDDKLDGKFPLPDGWVDAWAELKPGEDGFTYDTKSNQMLSGNKKLQKRLDRFHCHLEDYKISGIDIIGTEAISGISYCKEKKVKNEVKKLILPVLPSDHYGLLLTICRK